MQPVDAEGEAKAYAESQIDPIEEGPAGIITTKAKLKRRTERAFLAGWDAAMRASARKGGA